MQLLFSLYLAIKKSQKDASILVDRSCRGKGIWKEGPEKNIEAANIESSLLGQWKSLFQHMEHIFQHEAEELVSLLTVLLTVWVGVDGHSIFLHIAPEMWIRCILSVDH